MVLAVESSTRDREALARRSAEIRSLVGDALALPVADVVFLSAGKIPKTTSGKVRRERLRREYLDGTLPRLDRGPKSPQEG